MGKGHFRHARDTLRSNNRDRRPITDVEAERLPQIVIGRKVEPTEIYQYLAKVEELNKGRNHISVVDDEPVATLVSPAQFVRMVVPEGGVTPEGSRHLRYQVRSTKKALGQTFDSMREDDLAHAEAKFAVEKMMEYSYDLRERDLYQERVDAGLAAKNCIDFQRWASATLMVEKKPTLINETTVGLSLAPDQHLTGLNDQVMEALRMAGVGYDVLGRVGLQRCTKLVIPIATTEYPINSSRDGAGPIMPEEPPAALEVGPMEIFELPK